MSVPYYILEKLAGNTQDRSLAYAATSTMNTTSYLINKECPRCSNSNTVNPQTAQIKCHKCGLVYYR